MHVTSIEMLLWALGGFAEPYDDGPPSNWLTPSAIRQVRELAALPRFTWGETTTAAERLGLSTNSLRAIVCRARHGHVPAYWGAA